MLVKVDLLAFVLLAITSKYSTSYSLDNTLKASLNSAGACTPVKMSEKSCLDDVRCDRLLSVPLYSQLLYSRNRPRL